MASQPIEAARLSGVNADRVRILCYAISGSNCRCQAGRRRDHQGCLDLDKEVQQNKTISI